MAGARKEAEAPLTLSVAWLAGGFPNLYEHSLLAEMAAVAKQGVSCRVLALFPIGRALPEAFDDLPISIEYLGSDSLAGALAATVLHLHGELLRRPGETLRYPRLIRWRGRLRRSLSAERPGLLHSQFGHLGILAAPVARALDIPLIVSLRGQDVGLLRRASEADLGALQRQGRLFLARSEAMRSELISMGFPSERIEALPSGIDVAAIPFRERTAPARGEPVRLLAAGRLVAKKGIDDALRAVAECPDVALEIVGDGPERPRLAEMIARMRLTGRARLAGVMSHQALLSRMQAAHLFILPCKTALDGDREGIPNVLKEAQASGLPVISTRHAGIAECVEDGQSGLLSEEGDIPALAHNLRDLATRPERWTAMGRRGREIVQARYDLLPLVSKLVRRYHEVARR